MNTDFDPLLSNTPRRGAPTPFRGESEKMTNARWQAMGPEPPAPLGCRYVDSTRTGQLSGMMPISGGAAREIERDPNWTPEGSAPVINARNT